MKVVYTLLFDSGVSTGGKVGAFLLRKNSPSEETILKRFLFCSYCFLSLSLEYFLLFGIFSFAFFSMKMKLQASVFRLVEDLEVENSRAGKAISNNTTCSVNSARAWRT